MSGNAPENQASEIARLTSELVALQEELRETNQGVVALYSEIQDANEQLAAKNSELHEANEKLHEAQAAIAQHERNVAISQMVITFNHEINNPLFIIQGTVGLLDYKMKDAPQDILDKIRVIHEQCLRIGKVMARIREFENLLPKEYVNRELLDLGLDDTLDK